MNIELEWKKHICKKNKNNKKNNDKNINNKEEDKNNKKEEDKNKKEEDNKEDNNKSINHINNKDGEDEDVVSIRNVIVAVIIAGFSWVVAIAWTNLMEAVFKKYYPNNHESIVGRSLYFIGITIIAVILIYVIAVYVGE